MDWTRRCSIISMSYSIWQWWQRMLACTPPPGKRTTDETTSASRHRSMSRADAQRLDEHKTSATDRNLLRM
jgi:hypothetical protein